MIMACLADWKIEGTPQAILSTHKHHDHAGNNHRFAEVWPGIKIIGGAGEHVYMATHDIFDGQ